MVIRIGLSFFLFLFSIPILAQNGSPDALVFDYNFFHEVYIDKDSIRVHEVYLEGFTKEIDYETYTTIEVFLDDNDKLKEDIVWLERLSTLPIFQKGDQVVIDSLSSVFEIVDASHFYHIKDINPLGSGYYIADGIKRYEIYKSKHYQIGVFYRHGHEAHFVYQTKEKEFYVYDPYDEKQIISAIEQNKEPYVKTIRYERVGGYKKIEKNGKWGAVDLITNEVLLATKFDSVFLEKFIHVWKGGVVGAYDYAGKQVLPIAQKYLSYYSHDSRLILQYVDANNTPFMYDPKNKLTIIDSSTQIKELTGSLKENGPWKIAQKEDGEFYLGIRADNEPDGVKWAKKIGLSENYLDFNFDSGNKEGYLGSSHIMFGTRKDGKYDLFYFDSNPNSFVVAENVTYSIGLNLVRSSRGYDSDTFIILERDGLLSLLNWYGLETNFRYVEIPYALGNYHRFALPNGQKGWVDGRGNEYFDNK